MVHRGAHALEGFDGQPVGAGGADIAVGLHLADPGLAGFHLAVVGSALYQRQVGQRRYSDALLLGLLRELELPEPPPPMSGGFINSVTYNCLRCNGYFELTTALDVMLIGNLQLPWM